MDDMLTRMDMDIMVGRLVPALLKTIVLIGNYLARRELTAIIALQQYP